MSSIGPAEARQGAAPAPAPPFAPAQAPFAAPAHAPAAEVPKRAAGTGDVPGTSERPPEYRALPPEPAWVSFDPELERLCRIAAHVGGSQAAPISYTALIIAFLWDEGGISGWFRAFVGNSPSIETAAIYRSKDVAPSDGEHYRSVAGGGSLPDANPLYSRSTRNLLDQAARIARDISVEEPTRIVLGTRHLMAAYAFRNPSDHVDQVRGWGFDAERWRSEYADFIARISAGSGEDWGRLDKPALSTVPVIGSFTADDPAAPPHDLLDIEDEAAAFARIAAAESIKPPLAIGVFGEWGSGKTFFMRRIYDNVKELSNDAAKRHDAGGAQGPFLRDIVQIRFNAWHYIETNLWASLVEYIFTELDRWLRDKTESGIADAEEVFNRLATAQQLKLDALDSVVSRRAERRGAELRAERARREYEEALVRAAGVGAGTYARALMDTLLGREDVSVEIARIGAALGTGQLSESSGRVLDVLEQARSEAGRAQIVMRAGVARLGTWPWIASVVMVLIGVPLLAIALRNGVAHALNWPGLENIHETVIALSGALAGLAGWGGVLVRQASGALTRIDAFDRRLRKLADEEVEAAKRGTTAVRKEAAEDDVRKRKQALEAAEHALAEAEGRLNEARSDFESASARSRLNAFIRSKAIDGDYAKHLGIIAAIRRDFGQLAALMGAANDAEEQRAESRRLADEVNAAVKRFLDRLEKESDARLTVGEARSLLSLLEPVAALEVIENRRALFVVLLDGVDGLGDIEAGLHLVKAAKVPTLSRIILYIDDLDRCPPQLVVDVLQAVHLLLCFPLFTVVVAVDARWVSRALHERFPKLLGETGRFSSESSPGVGAGASSHDYLEKIFQIPYWVRPVDPAGAQRYVNTLVEPDVRRVALARAPDGHAADADHEPAARGSGAERPPHGDVAAPAAQTNVAVSGADPAAQADVPMSGATPAAQKNVLVTGATSTTPATAAAAGLELTRWEADALERFAPLIAATPRRLIRFVNLYRLLKTGLASEAQQSLVGQRGESDVYRSLIVQLAIVTGAPAVAPDYFRRLAAMNAADRVGALYEYLEKDPAFAGAGEADVVLRVLASARDWPGTALSVNDLRTTAPTARRYSFTAWGG